MGCVAGLEPATSRGQSEVTVFYTTAKPAPGTVAKGLSLPGEVTLGFAKAKAGSGSASCTRDLQVMSLTRYCSSIPRNWCPEKCSHLRLLLFRQALELSQLSRHVWCADPGSNGDARRHGVLNPRVSAEFHHRRMVGRPGGIRTHTESAFETHASAGCATGLKWHPRSDSNRHEQI